MTSYSTLKIKVVCETEVSVYMSIHAQSVGRKNEKVYTISLSSPRERRRGMSESSATPNAISTE